MRNEVSVAEQQQKPIKSESYTQQKCLSRRKESHSGCFYGVDLIPGLGTSACCRRSFKKKKKKGEIKAFLNPKQKTNLNEFIVSRPILQVMLKKVVQTEGIL